MRVEWSDLSDSELRAKLENRGVRPDLAKLIVIQRERPKAEQFIETVMRP